MPLQPSLVNNFTQGLKTEFTGLNFPENAAFDTDNCVYTLIGDVLRRSGIDYEENFTTTAINRAQRAVSSYKWNNAGGDGSTQVIALQVGATIYFYQSSNATITNPLSTTKLSSTVNLNSSLAAGSSNDPSIVECQFTDGNGYLFIFHPYCDPIYCTFDSGTITPNTIDVQIRDTTGIVEPGVAANFRPTTLTAEHQYNLQNQGWFTAPSWVVSWSASWTFNTGSLSETVQTGLTISGGQSFTGTTTVNVSGSNRPALFSGTVTSYNSGTGAIVLNISSISGFGGNTASGGTAQFSGAASLISTWHAVAALNNYPANSDVWWYFKNSSGNFDPSTTASQVTLSAGRAPRGYYILDAFNLNRTAVSSIAGLTTVSTTLRPKTGAWYQGRIWYSGVDSSSPSSGDAQFYSWSENIYFSQIVQTVADFGICYETNDPTSENLFDLLPSDGGYISIPGSGSIYKLFPVKMGMIVFAANGIWYITGGTSLGFEATDYTVVKIANIRSISGTSFVNVNGFPMFWNEEGIYYVAPSQQGGSAHSPDIALEVTNLCLGTILTFFGNIPLQSKKYARGDYDPIGYVVQWWYKSSNEVSITDRYQFDKALNFNTANKAFYPWTMNTTDPAISGLIYVSGPGGSTSPDPVFKYITSKFTGSTYDFTFSEERDDLNWADWNSTGAPVNYTSYFITGYKLSGKALMKFNPLYVYTYHNNITNTQYKIQGIWDYAINRNSNRYGSVQVITINLDTDNFGKAFRRHKIRGHGYVLQFKIQSVDGQPFDVQGWAVADSVNQAP